MSNPSLVAPITIQQVNRELYVGEGYLLTIQEAVDFAATNNDARFIVIIPPDYLGTELISSIVRGAATITLADRRLAQTQNYSWNGINYVPSGIHEMGDIKSDNEITGGVVRATRSDIAAAQPQTTYLEFVHTLQQARVVGTGVNPTTVAGVRLDGESSDYSQGITYLECTPTGTTMANDVTVNGDITGISQITSPIVRATQSGIGEAQPQTAYLEFDHPDNQARLMGTGPDPATIAGVRLDGESSDYSESLNYLYCTPQDGCTFPVDLTVEGELSASSATISDFTASAINADTITTPSLTALAGEFDTCLVADSPVRTFANSPDGGGGGGMEWPPAGIAVSTGTSWDDSLPITAYLPLTLTGNTTVNTAAGNLTLGSGAGTGSVGTIYLGASTPANAVTIRPGVYGSSLQWRGSLNAIGQDFNTLGTTYGCGDFLTGGGNPNGPPQLATQTYTALFNHNATSPSQQIQFVWAVSNPTAVTKLYVRNSTFPGWSPWTELLHDDGAGNLNLTGNLAAATLAATANNLAGITASAQGPIIGWNVSNAEGETDFVNSPAAAGGGFHWYNEAPGTVVDSTTQPAMKLDNSSNLSVAGSMSGMNLNLFGSLYLNSTAGIASIGLAADGNLHTYQPQSLLLNWEAGAGVTFGNGNAGQVARIDNLGNFTASNAQIAGGGSFGGNLSSNGQILVANNAIRIGQQIGAPLGNTCEIRTDNSLPRTFIDSWGDLDINLSHGGGVTIGTAFYAAQKNFRITHPQDENKWLIHSTLEGPEIAVLYRGEGQTDATGTATVMLPDYFEALTRPEGRTVQLTELFEDDDDTELGKLSASRVKDGRFRVRSEFASMKFYWEVKAVRSDVDPLEVERDKEAHDRPDFQRAEPAQPIAEKPQNPKSRES
jgi:hypothetical protein